MYALIVLLCVGIGATLGFGIRLWSVFENHGMAGWKALIPVYNLAVYFKLMNSKELIKPVITLIALEFLVAMYLINWASGLFPVTGWLAVALFAILICLVIRASLLKYDICHNLAARFNKDKKFEKGLFWFTPSYLGKLAG